MRIDAHFYPEIRIDHFFFVESPKSVDIIFFPNYFDRNYPPWARSNGEL